MPFKKETSLKPFFGSGIGFPFYKYSRVTLLKTISLTIIIIFSVIQFNLHYHSLTFPPPPPIKWKSSRTLTITSKKLSTSTLLNRKRYFQGLKSGFTFGSGLAPFKKRNLGDHFLEVVLDFHFIGTALLKANSLTVLNTYSFAIYFNISQYYTILLPTHTSPSIPIKLDDGWPESEKAVFQAALSMVVVKNSRW